MRMLPLLFLLGIIAACQPNTKTETTLPPYPIAPSVTATDTYFGKTVTDEYRNLEDLKDPAVVAWFKEEGAYANKILEGLDGRAEFIAKMKEYDQRKSHAVRQINATADGQLFFLKQGADEDVPRLFYRKNFESKDELLFDAKDFNPESGNTYIINYISPSPDGAYALAAVSHSGNEISEMLTIDMKTRKVLPQIIGHCWPSDGGGVSWLPDNRSFIYLYYAEIDHLSKDFLKDMRSVRYTIGDDPEKLNILISKVTHPNLDILADDFPVAISRSKKDKYIFAPILAATAYSDAYYAESKDINSGKLDWKPLYSTTDKLKEGYFKGEQFIYISGKNSTSYQILSKTVGNAAETPKILADSKPDEVIGEMQPTSKGLFYTTTKNGVEGHLYLYKEGKSTPIQLPTQCGRISITGIGADFPDLWVTTSGWLSDYTRYRYKADSNEFIEENIAPKIDFPEFKDFVVKELLVPSHDGALVPLSIIHKKDIRLDGQHPVLLYGYGSYSISIPPNFSPSRLTWVEQGGIHAVAHVRGGGEKGDAWYQAGKKVNKPNTWKDLIACTEYLIKEGYTTNKKVAINGGSAGGIMIGRAMTERPDLFAVAIPEVGSLNPLRAEQMPSGATNSKEFGTIKDSIECAALLAMDAYHHIKKGDHYPAALITAGMNDPRVIAWGPGKFAAKLQAANASDKPILFAVDFEAGHGIGDPKTKRFARTANKYAFALWQMEK